MLTALLFVFLFGPAIIRSLRLRQGKGQPIREDGPQRHLIPKQGTPTMGGLMILSGVTVATAAMGQSAPIPMCGSCSASPRLRRVGFYDDYLKVTKQTHTASPAASRSSSRPPSRRSPAARIVHVGAEPFATSLAIPFFKAC